MAPRHGQGVEDPQPGNRENAHPARGTAGHHLQGTDGVADEHRLQPGCRGDAAVAGRPRPPRTEPRGHRRGAEFGGRLFLLGDIDAVPALTDAERAEFLAIVNRSLDGKVEAIGWGHDGPAIRQMLKANAVPHQEAFLVGAGMAHQVLGESAGLPFTKDIDSWFQ